MTIDFGKNKGRQISECDTKYLRWLVSHERVLALRNRWASRDARFELQRRAATLAAQTLEAEMAVKIAEEIIATQKYPVNKYGISDVSMAGSLNGSSQGFHLLR